MIQHNKNSRVKEKNNRKIVFERIEEFEINNIEEAQKSLARIDDAIRDIDASIEAVKKHKAMLEFERAEIVKFIESFKKK
jgi:hypothetical protein